VWQKQKPKHSDIEFAIARKGLSVGLEPPNANLNP
jgi:hypothetical protein